jgi:Fe-S cluster assembly ATPase SufC
MKALRINRDMLEGKLNMELSGGENKRMELLQMYVAEPKSLFLDEIDTGLDIDSIAEMGKFIQSWLQNHKPTTIVITHNFQFLQYFDITNVIVLKDGGIASVGNKTLLKQLHKDGFAAIEQNTNFTL